ncbi:MAG: T9SS type A sorting domain-containing protein [Bacteroidota bacterium]
MISRYSLPLLALGLLVGSVDVSAQERISTPVSSVSATEAAQRGGTVLSYVDPATDSQITNTAQGGGFVWGTNSFGDRGKYSCFDLPGGQASIDVPQVDLFLTRAVSPVTTSYDIVFYTGAPGFGGQDGAGPQTETYRQTFDVTTITATDPSALTEATVHTLATAQTITESFCVGIEWPASAGVEDLFVKGTVDRGLGGDNPNQWELWNDGRLFNMSEAWTDFSADMWLDVQFTSSVANEETELTRGTLSNVTPNPMRDRASVDLTLEESDVVSVTLVDMLGREVESVYEGPLASGTRTFTLRSGTLRAGVYVLRVEGETILQSRVLTITR